MPMGSMSKVMQKIQADGAASETPPAPETEAAEAQAPLTEDAQTPPETVNEQDAPDAVAGEETPPSAFIAEEQHADEIVDIEDGQTVQWDAKRVDPVVVAFHDRYSAICEQYRSVRARLLTMNTAQAQQVIAVTSSIPEEGKSVSTVNLGLVMAEGGEHRILIADGDFRRTSLARMLGIPSRPGLADVLRGEVALEEALQPSPFPNLKVLPAGHVRDGGYAELLGRPSAAVTLDEIRAAFDYTFVDTPPITTVSDVCLLAPHCDGAIMVVEMRRTPEPTVQQAVRTLQANNVKVLGCLLSRFRDRGSGYYEHYYSSYYTR
jgi:receptor protein-tyrosine kinase